MRKFSVLILALSAGFSASAQNPTWSDDIACLVYSHCSPCHNSNGSAPFSLMSYTDAVNNATMMKAAIEAGAMPPWPVDNRYRKFAHDRSLTDAEKASFMRWVSNGKPEGNPANAPAAPVYASSLQIPQPDLRIKMPVYTIPSISEDLYRCFVIPSGINQQKYITSLEIIPGNRNVVHHVQVFYDTGNACVALDLADPAPGYTSAGGVGSPSAVLLGTWVPGSSASFMPAGMGKRLPANAKIIMQLHYPDYASGATDSSSVHFSLTNGPVRNITDAAVLNHMTTMVNGPLFIPANTVKTFYQRYTVPINATILSIGPHGHLICKSLKAYGISPLGDTIPLINIPEWDFHWQGFYDFPNPVKIPAGTVLCSEGVYDNTANNLHNPNNPPKNVSAGEGTSDEMMLFYFSFLFYQNGDELIVVDTAGHRSHHLDCISDDRSSLAETQLQTFRVFPNPVSDVLGIQSEIAGFYRLEILNTSGQLLAVSGDRYKMDVSFLKPGMYLLRMVSDSGNRYVRIIKE